MGQSKGEPSPYRACYRSIGCLGEEKPIFLFTEEAFALKEALSLCGFLINFF